MEIAREKGANWVEAEHLYGALWMRFWKASGLVCIGHVH